MTVKQGILRDSRCERINLVLKCKIFEAVNLTLHGHYTHGCTVSKVIGISTERNMSANQGMHKVLIDDKE